MSPASKYKRTGRGALQGAWPSVWGPPHPPDTAAGPAPLAWASGLAPLPRGRRPACGKGRPAVCCTWPWPTSLRQHLLPAPRGPGPQPRRPRASGCCPVPLPSVRQPSASRDPCPHHSRKARDLGDKACVSGPEHPRSPGHCHQPWHPRGGRKSTSRRPPRAHAGRVGGAAGPQALSVVTRWESR